MQNLIDQLQAIETLLEKAIDSDEYRQLQKFDCNPDVSLGDALQGVRQAILSSQGTRRIPYTSKFVDAPWLSGGRSRSTDGSTYGDFLAYDDDCAALAAENAETLPQQDIGVLSNDDKC